MISRFQQQNVCQMLTTQHSSFLYTVSRLVSSRDIRRRGSEDEGGRLLHVTDPDPTIKPKSYPKPPVMQTLFYIHVIAFFAILTLCWLDTLPGVGRVSGIKRDISLIYHLSTTSPFSGNFSQPKIFKAQVPLVLCISYFKFERYILELIYHVYVVF